MVNFTGGKLKRNCESLLEREGLRDFCFGIASFPRSRGKYFRKLFRIRLRRIEWQALRG